MNDSAHDVFFTACGDYGESLGTALGHLLTHTGWFESKEWAGKRVLLKPNLLTDRRPNQAVTTHPELLRHIIRTFKAAGAFVSVGDSPASTANLKAVLSASGIGSVCQEEGVPFVPFEQTGVQNFEKDGFAFPISRPVLDANIIINLPKVKSHSLTKLTAAVKNLYGAVPGYAKTMLHRKYPKPVVFGKLLQAIWSVLPPSLTIADGIVGMEGQGPANGRPVKLGFLAASKDPFALDTALCGILHIDTRGVPYLQGLASDHTPRMQGDKIEVESFEVPSGAHLLNLLPEGFVHYASRIVWVRPGFDKNLCIGCGQCCKACPMQALTLSPRDGKPELAKNKCISCACCHEICPKGAIHMTQSLLLRLAHVFKGMD